jgi:osmoprotectant transport system permease protein
MAEQLALLPSYLTAHLQLSLTALSMGVLISVPLGLWVARRPRLESMVLGGAGVLQTIPGLALLALMVLPFGIGFLPAIVVLTLYSVLPILRNTVTGIATLDPALIEAARGVGMTPSQRTRLVELPLALPMIVAGIRTATVWVVGTATLATVVGATSLGNYIFAGLQTRNTAAVLMGSASAAVLALALDALVRSLEVGLQRRSRRLSLGAFGVLVALGLYALGAAVADRITDLRSPPITIGAKTFTEQYILSAILAGRIEQESGLAAHNLPSLGSTVAFDALRSGDLDLYVDYTGTIWATIMKRTGLPDDREQLTREVGEFLQREHGILMLGSLGFENTYALGMRAGHAASLGVKSISDLAPLIRDLSIAGDFEFFSRAEWKALENRYGLAPREQRTMDAALMYQAVAAGEVDIISAYSTDGRIAALDLVLLYDDKGVIPPYDAILLASPRLQATNPGVLDDLKILLGSIDAERMQSMNWSVDQEGRSPEAVAAEFLNNL